MTALLVLLSGFAIWSTQTTRTATEDVARRARVSDQYQQASIAAVQEDAVVSQYQLKRASAPWEEFGIRSDQVVAALRAVQRNGDSSDGARVQALLAQHASYVDAVSVLFTDVDGRVADSTAQPVDATTAQGLASNLGPALRSAAAVESTETQDSLASMTRADAFVSRVTPIVFGIGMALMGVFGAIVLAYRKRVERQAADADYQALHDGLTGLPNRALFRDRGERALATLRRNRRLGGVMMLDLDRFKDVNDTLGHHHGDELLRQVGKRITGTLRKADTVARLGGDEFTILLPEVASAEAAATVAAKVARALERPYAVEGVTVDLEASVGVALFPDHGADIDTLMRHSYVAMSLAKRKHTNVAVYSADLEDNAPRRLALLGELRRALERRELVVFYQPQADMASRAVTGVEALVRWQHPELGLIPPGDFIPLAERTGLIHPLTTYVLSEALQQAHAWASEGTPMAVAVNISARSLLNANFPDMVAAVLARWEVPAEMLELEITENTLMTDPGEASRALLRLREMGVALSIDDFGTGYSSLAYLSELPVQTVKIDRSFVMQLPEHAANRLIITSIVSLGRNLGMRVIAEGIETEAAWAELAELGCDVAQGYYLTRPVPPAALSTWLTNWTAATDNHGVPAARPA